MKENFPKIKKIIAEKFGVSEENITLEADLKTDLNLSDLEINDLVSFLLQEFNLHLNENDALEITTVNSLVEFVEEYSKDA